MQKGENGGRTRKRITARKREIERLIEKRKTRDVENRKEKGRYRGNAKDGERMRK